VPEFGSIPVPEDVAAAVRRAIAAIEAATGTPTGLAKVTFGPMQVASTMATQAPSTFEGRNDLTIIAEPDPSAGGITPTASPAVMAAFASFDAVSSANKKAGSSVSNGMNGLVELKPLGPPPDRILHSAKAPAISPARRGALRRLIDGIHRSG
jgi:hypothetical protein